MYKKISPKKDTLKNDFENLSRLSPSPPMVSAIQETLKIGEITGGEGGSALRYALISAQEPPKIGGRSARRKEP